MSSPVLSFEVPPGVDQISHFGRVAFKKKAGVERGALQPGIIQQTAMRYADAQSPPHCFLVKWGKGEFYTFVDAQEFATFYIALHARGAVVSAAPVARGSGPLLTRPPRKDDLQWYELIPEGRPCFWMNDVEYILAEGDPTAHQRYQLLGDWLFAVASALGVKDQVGSALDLTGIRVLNGSRSAGPGLVKHSFHVLFRCVVAEDTDALKRLFVGIGQKIIREWPDTDALSLFFYEQRALHSGAASRQTDRVHPDDQLWAGRLSPPPPNVRRKCMIDFCIYSRNRGMRVIGSLKEPNKEKRWEALWPQPVWPQGDAEFPKRTVFKRGTMTTDDVLEHLYTSTSRAPACAWKLTNKEMRGLLKKHNVPDPGAPPHAGPPGGDEALIGLEHKIPGWDFPKGTRGPELVRAGDGKTSEDKIPEGQAKGVRDQLLHLIRSRGDASSDVLSSPFPHQSGANNDCYRGVTRGKRVCPTGAIHEKNHFYMLVDRGSGQVKYGCLSSECTHTLTNGIVVGRVAGGRVLDKDDRRLLPLPPDRINHQYEAEQPRALGESLREAEKAGCPFVMIRSAMGTGKSKALRAHLERRIRGPNDRILMITHRRCIATRDFVWAQDMGFHLYSEEKQSALQDFPRLVVQYESIHWLSTASDFDLIILDEIESTATNMTCYATNKNNLVSNSQAFARLIQRANRVVTLDADTAARALSIAENLMGTVTPRVWVEVNTRPPAPRTVFLHPSLETWQNELLTRLREGKNACVCINSFNGGHRVLDWLGHQGLHLIDPSEDGKMQEFRHNVCRRSKPHPRQHQQRTKQEPQGVLFRFYTSYGNDIVQTQDFEDVNVAWKKLQLVMYTSKVSCGLSFEEEKHFDCVFAYGSNQSCSPRVLHQMIGRVRDPIHNHIHLYVSENKRRPRNGEKVNKALTLQEVQEALNHHACGVLGHEQKLIGSFTNYTHPTTGAKTSQWVRADDWLFHVLCHNILEENLAKNDYTGQLKQLFTGYGYTVTEPAPATGQPTRDKKIQDEQKKSIEAEMKLWFELAPVLSAEEADQVTNSSRKNRAIPIMKIALRKYMFQRHFHTPVTFALFTRVERLLPKVHNVAAGIHGCVSTAYTDERRRGQGFQLLAETSQPTSQKLAFMIKLAKCVGLTSPVDCTTILSPEHLESVRSEAMSLVRREAKGVLDGFSMPPKGTRKRKRDGESPDVTYLVDTLSKVWTTWGMLRFNADRARFGPQGRTKTVSNRRLTPSTIRGASTTMIKLAQDSTYLTRLTDLARHQTHQTPSMPAKARAEGSVYCSTKKRRLN